MKSYIDFFETFKGEFIASKKFRSRFINYWGTTEIDGVRVLNKRFTIYPGTNTNVNIGKLCRLLGMWSQVKEANFSTIAGYYLYFNPNKDKESQEELKEELLAEKIDLYCPLDVWKYATINYIDKNDPTKFDGWTKEQILTYIDNDYRNIFDYGNGFVAADTVEEEAIGKYVLFDDGTEFEVEVLSVVKTAIVPEIADNHWVSNKNRRTRYTGLSMEIRFKRITVDVSVSGALMTAIKSETSSNKIKQLAAMQASTSSIYNTDGYSIWDSPTTTSDIWYKDRLRYDALMSQGVRTKDVLKILLGTLDTGQIKKKVKWYKKILGFVLIVIAIAIAVFSVGTGAPLSTMLTAIAIAVGVSVLVMTVIQAQWAKSNAAAAGYMGRWVKIGGIVSMVAGITAAITNIATNLAAEAAKQSATQAIASASSLTLAEASAITASMTTAEIAATNVALGITGEITVSTVTTMAKDWLMSSWKSMSLKVAGMAVSSRQADMESRLQDKSEYLQELQDANEEAADKNMSIGLKDLEFYTDNLDRIKTRYDYDYLYEPEASTIHIGNIQRASSYKATGLNLRAEDLM